MPSDRTKKILALQTALYTTQAAFTSLDCMRWGIGFLTVFWVGRDQFEGCKLNHRLVIRTIASKTCR